jgi:hypothetical protein
MQKRRRTWRCTASKRVGGRRRSVAKEALSSMARELQISSNIRKALLIQQIAKALTDSDTLKQRVGQLSDPEKQALRDVLEVGGTLPWDEFASRYDHDLDESPYWIYHRPETIMGRLRFFGLLCDGTVDGEYVVLIPQELRALLPAILAGE